MAAAAITTTAREKKMKEIDNSKAHAQARTQVDRETRTVRNRNSSNVWKKEKAVFSRKHKHYTMSEEIYRAFIYINVQEQYVSRCA